MRPVVIVNFKTYERATGERAVWLAKACQQAGREYNVDMRVAVQATDIHAVVEAVDIPVYAQHADPVEPGQHTGSVTVRAVQEAGAAGVLINHSEHRLKNEDVIVAAHLAQREGMETVVFAEDAKKIELFAKHIAPTFFCVEPPELIAGDVSVSVAKPDVVKHAVHATRTPVLVGAGVKRYTDLELALEMRAAGVVLASGIVCADHKEKAFEQLLSKHPSHRKD